jgi:hypothetical protein
MTTNVNDVIKKLSPAKQKKINKRAKELSKEIKDCSETFNCNCYDLGHVLRLSKWEKDFSIELQIAENESFWWRLRYAWHSLYKTNYTMSMDVIIKKEDIPRFKKFVAKL